MQSPPAYYASQFPDDSHPQPKTTQFVMRFMLAIAINLIAVSVVPQPVAAITKWTKCGYIDPDLCYCKDQGPGKPSKPSNPYAVDYRISSVLQIRIAFSSLTVGKILPSSTRTLISLYVSVCDPTSRFIVRQNSRLSTRVPRIIDTDLQDVFGIAQGILQ
ncbi:hypothetical protein MJO29_005084 [Puccinia striiformis f. sp. tritici]|nr:hypothetical protein MJO29_005084 [Puccinia striiformis f. sp. tritici]